MKSINRTRDRCGSALFTVLLVIFMVSSLIVSMHAFAMHRSNMAQRLADYARAVAIAEAGANAAYVTLLDDFSARSNSAAFPSTTYGGGAYDPEVVPISTNMAIIRSVGTYNLESATVILDIKDYGELGNYGSLINSEAFEYGMVAGGTLDFRGCGNISTTGGAIRAHVNGVMDIRGDAGANLDISSSTKIKISNNVTVDGDVTAPDLFYNPARVTVTGAATEESVPLVTVPNIDLTPYYNWAEDHGEVYSSMTIDSDTTLAPNGGVIWVEGDLVITGDVDIQGSIIATGNIHITGNGDITAPGTFALASRDGNITITTSGDIEGLVYTKTGDLDMTSNGSVTGQLVVAGDLKKSGVSDVFVYEKTIPGAPGAGPDVPNTQIIGVSAWQQ